MISRRDFLKASGLTLAIVWTGSGFQIVKGSPLNRHSPRLWINLSPDNVLTVLINKSEMGQGVYTGLAQIVAEELSFPWERVRAKPSPVNENYVDPYIGLQLTGGSTSIRNMFDILRSAGAVMRELLREVASKRWGVSKDSIVVRDGYVVNLKTGESFACGELSQEAMELPMPKDYTLKSPEEFTHIGKSLSRLDLEDKVEGKAIFGVDAPVENAVFVTLINPPGFGSKPISLDTSEAKKVKGFVDAFVVEGSVAVCGEDPHSLLTAKEKLKIRWSKGPLEDFDTRRLEDYYLKLLEKRPLVARDDGNAKKVISKAKLKASETYILPYLYHACMEPISCGIELKGNKATVYAPTQSQTILRARVAKALGIPVNKVEVITTYLGGGFGRKSNNEVIEKVAKVAKRLGRSVRFFYTREEDFKEGWFRPMCAVRMEGSVNSEGVPEALYFKIAVPAVFEWAGRRSRGVDSAAVAGVANSLYEIPNFRVEFVKSPLPIPVWFWRSVGHSHNAYLMETFLDHLISLAGADPVEVRLKLLEFHPRAYGVVETAAEKARWHEGPKEGQALGIAYHFSFGTHVAQVAEVSYSDGKVKVHRVVCAVDLGPLVVNPDLVVQQMESGIIMGLSAFLYEGVAFKNGGPANTNFDSYRLLTIDECPQIEVHIVRSEGSMGGIGEPGVPPIAPAVANALRKITGKVITRLPFYGLS